MEGRALKPSWADPPRTSPCPLRFVYLGFVAFLWQIPPIRPVLPVLPVYNCFAVNNLRLDQHLHTVEVVGSNPAVPTNIINNLEDGIKMT
jgi:hypothetical protein